MMSSKPCRGTASLQQSTQTRQMCPLVFICERPRMVFVALSLATNNWYKLTKLRSATLHSLSPTSFAVQPDMSAIVAMSLIALPKFLNRFKCKQGNIKHNRTNFHSSYLYICNKSDVIESTTCFAFLYTCTVNEIVWNSPLHIHI